MREWVRVVSAAETKRNEDIYVVAYREFWEPVGVAEIWEQG